MADTGDAPAVGTFVPGVTAETVTPFASRSRMMSTSKVERTLSNGCGSAAVTRTFSASPLEVFSARSSCSSFTTLAFVTELVFAVLLAYSPLVVPITSESRIASFAVDSELSFIHTPGHPKSVARATFRGFKINQNLVGISRNRVDG